MTDTKLVIRDYQLISEILEASGIEISREGDLHEIFVLALQVLNYEDHTILARIDNPLQRAIRLYLNIIWQPLLKQLSEQNPWITVDYAETKRRVVVGDSEIYLRALHRGLNTALGVLARILFLINKKGIDITSVDMIDTVITLAIKFNLENIEQLKFFLEEDRFDSNFTLVPCAGQVQLQIIENSPLDLLLSVMKSPRTRQKSEVIFTQIILPVVTQVYTYNIETSDQLLELDRSMYARASKICGIFEILSNTDSNQIFSQNDLNELARLWETISMPSTIASYLKGEVVEEIKQIERIMNNSGLPLVKTLTPFNTIGCPAAIGRHARLDYIIKQSITAVAALLHSPQITDLVNIMRSIQPISQ